MKMSRYTILSFLFVFGVSLHSAHCSLTVYQKIKTKDEYSNFNKILQKNTVAKMNLMYSDRKPMTVFVPRNDQLVDYSLYANMPLYHMSFDFLPLHKFSSEMVVRTETALENYTLLWLCKYDEKGYFVNDAKILTEESNVISEEGQQVIHLIDRVLNPQMRRPYPNPTALDFLNNIHYWWTQYRVQKFQSRVKLHRLESLFSEPQNTYLIPIDSNDYDEEKFQQIDPWVIRAHVIPDWILFSRATSEDFKYNSDCNEDAVKVQISFVKISGKRYVRSNTVIGDDKHPKGEVLSEIVQSDIPLVNGVVHLIAKPLAVFPAPLKPFPHLTVHYKIVSDPELSKTSEYGLRTGFNDLLTEHRQKSVLVYFAPRNHAWNHLEKLNQLKNSALERILKRHLVVTDRRINLDELVLLSRFNGTTLHTLAGPFNLRFYREKGEYFVRWKGVSMKIHRADWQCSDGVVHVIDGVFMDANEDLVVEKGFWNWLKKIFS